ncbi:MAG: peptidase, partial [Ruminococcus sp.]|nr:peptidase [Ruminococcus sp.]
MINVSVSILIAVVILILIIIIRCFRIVPQAHVFVIERLGSFRCEWQTGLHILVPFIDRIAGKVSLKEKVVDFKPQPVITKDNVTMQIDTVVFYQITDAKQYIYGVERPLDAI